MVARLVEAFFAQINRVLVWHRMPTLPLRVTNLLFLRRSLRRLNLHDTQRGGFPKPQREVGSEVYRLGRTLDGSYNDLAVPAMGSAGMRFGRNTPIETVKIPTAREIMEPNPREVSRRLLARRPGEFYGVPHLNIFAAAWLQFMTHDWFGHQRDESNPHEIALADDDDWDATERKMRFGRSLPDKEAYADRGLPPAFTNTESHWWDSGQIYGKDETKQHALRTHSEGKLRVTAAGRLEIDEANRLELTGMNDNWWIGLSLLHTLFTREHNSICDRLIASYPMRRNDDEWLFQKARLVNIAVIAKIHTVEWTPALLNNPTMRFAMRGNWWGAFGETFYRERGRTTRGETMQGIPGSDTNHHAAPYSLTEEFVAVYRMHPLIPDVFDFRRLADDAPVASAEALDFRGVSGRRTLDLYGRMTPADAAYSLGTRNPGQVRLHNYPRGLGKFERQDSTTGSESHQLFDLATVDIVRDRERGVPRYNDFRRMLRMKPFATIGEMTSNKEWATEIAAVYGNDVEKVDTLVGLLAEDLPEGFGFSDTAFRIFILMASRRLKSDRFFTVDYTADMYTPEGMDWINRTFMTDIWLRHLPELEPALRGVKNAFFKWRESKPQ